MSNDYERTQTFRARLEGRSLQYVREDNDWYVVTEDRRMLSLRQELLFVEDGQYQNVQITVEAQGTPDA
jgi:hypothetical protein